LRLALAISGIEFEDERITFEEFGKQQKEGKFAYGAVPVLVVDGTTEIAQSNAILRYIGKRSDLYPKNDLEAAKVDELLDAVEDVAVLLTPSLREKDEAKKIEMRKALREETLPKWFGFIEKRIEKFGKGHFAVGDHLTVADLKIAQLVEWVGVVGLDHIPKEIVDSFPKIKAIHQTVGNNEKVKEWRSKHKN